MEEKNYKRFKKAYGIHGYNHYELYLHYKNLREKEKIHLKQMTESFLKLKEINGHPDFKSKMLKK